MTRILVFHTGSLGDTLIALPALWAIRKHFTNSNLTLLYDTQVGSNRVIAAGVLQGSGLIDDFITYSLLARTSALPLHIYSIF